MTAARMRAVINSWETVRYELLNTRVSHLGLAVEGSPIEPLVERLKSEFTRHSLRFVPSFYLTDCWGCPDREPIIGVPFYLADKRLSRLEQEQTGEIEDRHTVMMLLRHEGGHAVNYAYRLWEDAEWTETFGRFSTPYRDTFRPDPVSRRFVRHLAFGPYERPTYAQKHPDEDFAETFAVWMTPGSRWQKRYGSWPVIRKLRYVAKLMRRIRDSEPVVPVGKPYLPMEAMNVTVAEHYGRRAEKYRAAAQGYVDDKLHQVFPPVRGAPQKDARRFLRENRRALIARVTQWSGMGEEDAAAILQKLEDRAAALRLRLRPDQESAKLLDLTSLATALATEFSYTGRLAD